MHQRHPPHTHTHTHIQCWMLLTKHLGGGERKDPPAMLVCVCVQPVLLTISPTALQQMVTWVFCLLFVLSYGLKSLSAALCICLCTCVYVYVCACVCVVVRVCLCALSIKEQIAGNCLDSGWSRCLGTARVVVVT